MEAFTARDKLDAELLSPSWCHVQERSSSIHVDYDLFSIKKDLKVREKLMQLPLRERDDREFVESNF